MKPAEDPCTRRVPTVWPWHQARAVPIWSVRLDTLVRRRMTAQSHGGFMSNRYDDRIEKIAGSDNSAIELSKDRGYTIDDFTPTSVPTPSPAPATPVPPPPASDAGED